MKVVGVLAGLALVVLVVWGFTHQPDDLGPREPETCAGELDC